MMLNTSSKPSWSNLAKGTCPLCSELLEKTGQLDRKNRPLITCTCCEFSIREKKYNDLILGKESNRYKQKLLRWKAIERYHIRKAELKKEEEERIRKDSAVQRKERIDNLKRMLARGQITVEEFNTKSAR